jgi:hypothetical protein
VRHVLSEKAKTNVLHEICSVVYDVNAQEVFLKSSFNIKISEPICSIMSQADKPTDASKSDLSQNDETETDETLAGKTFGNDVRTCLAW